MKIHNDIDNKTLTIIIFHFKNHKRKCQKVITLFHFRGKTLAYTMDCCEI